MAAKVVAAVTVDMELKTTTPNPPLGAVQRPVSILPDDTGRFVCRHECLRILNMNSDVGF